MVLRVGTRLRLTLLADLEVSKQDRVLVTIQDVHTNLASSDAIGAAKDGMIRMSANIHPTQDHQALADTGKVHFLGVYDQGYINGVRDGQKSHFLAMTYRTRHEEPTVQGLVLEPTRRALHEYEHIGTFLFNPDARQEFEGFDSDNLEMHMIVLV